MSQSSLITPTIVQFNWSYLKFREIPRKC